MRANRASSKLIRYRNKRGQVCLIAADLPFRRRNSNSRHNEPQGRKAVNALSETGSLNATRIQIVHRASVLVVADESTDMGFQILADDAQWKFSQSGIYIVVNR